VTAKNTTHFVGNTDEYRPAKNIFPIRWNTPQLPAVNVAVLVLHTVLFQGIRKTARAHENLQLVDISFYLTYMYILEVLLIFIVVTTHGFYLFKLRMHSWYYIKEEDMIKFFSFSGNRRNHVVSLVGMVVIHLHLIF